MKIAKYILFLLLGAGGLTTACSDNDDYAPGEPAAEGCQQVYFSKDNQSETTLAASSKEPRSVTLTVLRKESSSAVTVPVNTLSKSEGMEIPESVSFAAGQAAAELEISIPADAQTGDSYSYHIELAGEHVNPYAEQEGSIQFFGTIKVAVLIEATCYLANIPDNTFKLVLEKTGENEYKIDNFLESGYYLSLSVDQETGNLTASSNYGYQYGDYWYLYDTNTASYLPFYTVVSYIVALYNAAGYSYWDEANKKACIYLYNVYYENDDMQEWDQIMMSWSD